MYDFLYEKNGFHVYKVLNGYVVVNPDKDFKNGHTHLDNLSQCEKIIFLASKRKLPMDLPLYFLTSLGRITEGEYSRQAFALAEKRGRKQKYYRAPVKKSVN